MFYFIAYMAEFLYARKNIKEELRNANSNQNLIYFFHLFNLSLKLTKKQDISYTIST